MATDKQVEQAQTKVEKLRQEVAALNADREVAEREALNDTRLAQFAAEERQLQVELEYAKRLKAARTKGRTAATDGMTDIVAPAAVGTTITTEVNRSGEVPATGDASTEKGK